MSDEEKEAINNLRLNVTNVGISVYDGTTSLFKMRDIQIVLNLIEKQSKEIEELKETLKCTQNSWFEDTQKIEEMKKQIDLDNECEIALNNKIMDLEKEIEELKEKDNANLAYYDQIYQNGIYTGQKAVEYKIKAKIEELQEDIKYSANPLSIDNSKFGIKVLQSLLEKE